MNFQNQYQFVRWDRIDRINERQRFIIKEKEDLTGKIELTGCSRCSVSAGHSEEIIAQT
jgi:hypothetical protein